MDKKINEMVMFRPWALKQDTLNHLANILERHLQGVKLSEEEIAAATAETAKKNSPQYEVVNGIANIPIFGVISKRASMVGAISQPQGTSVAQIQKDFQAALNDTAVKSILLNIDSPGGSVDGILELSDVIFSARGKKPIISFANGQMDSAAYWLGSSADKVYTSKSAEVGSIGVYTVINDYSVLYHNEGIKKQVIKAGKFKASGDPSQPLSEDAKALIQEEIDSYYDLFVGAIARNRGMSQDDVVKVADGRVFIGQKAISAGLADGLSTIDMLLGASSSGTSGTQTRTSASGEREYIESTDLNKNKTKEKQSMEITVENLKAEHKAVANALIEEGKAAGIVEGKSGGIAEGKALGIQESKAIAEADKNTAIKAEQARCAGILEAMPIGANKIAAAAIKEGLSIESAKGKYLDAINAGTIKSVGDAGGSEASDAASAAELRKLAEKNESDPDGSKHLARAKEYAKEHKCTMTEALKETAIK